MLRRLKPEVSAVRAALSNLPRTLDETYERIFLAIPEEDWVPVQHVFHWLVYHNDLYGSNIPLSTLLHAVQQSTINLLASNLDEIYNFEGLRECCGCLIMVEQEEMRDFDKTVPYRRSTVSFAHYTVKEYLQSSRISQKNLGFFALAQERIQKQFAEIVFRQALAIQPDILARYKERTNDGLIHSLLDTDFKLYCGVSSALQLNIWSETISSDMALMELSEALVNPHRPSYEDLTTLLTWADEEALLSNSHLSYDFYFWAIAWRQVSDPNLAVFLSFLLVSGFLDTTHLARAFATKHSMLTILTQQLHITKAVIDVFDYDAIETYELVGSPPEIAAQCAFRQPNTFDFILALISELGVAHFDVSTVLLLYVGCHDHSTCKESCSLERLLSWEANPNGPERAFVTPLQIAVVCWDLQGIEMLLNAGAKPNALGSKGSRWAPHSLMEQFNHLHGQSSLHIIKYSECKYQGDLKHELGRDETVRKRIESRLLESGAVEIAPENFESTIDSDSSEIGDSGDQRTGDDDHDSAELDE
jgi:hypothetical protein